MCFEEGQCQVSQLQVSVSCWMTREESGFYCKALGHLDWTTVEVKAASVCLSVE